MTLRTSQPGETALGPHTPGTCAGTCNQIIIIFSHSLLVQGEIGEHDPHHGPRAVGASALQKALARIQGDKAEQIMSKYTAPEEVLELPGHCMACNAEAVTRVFQTSIPYFKVPALFPSWLSISLSCPPVGFVHLHFPTLAQLAYRCHMSALLGSNW